MKEKVLLIHPEISRTKYNFKGVIDNEPLELEYIVAVLKEEAFEVRIWDGQVAENTVKDVIEEWKPEHVYICGRTRQENFMKEYARLAKENGAKTYICGLHAQHNYERFKEDYVDFCIMSFDPYIFKALLKGEKPESIDSIMYQADAKEGSTTQCNDSVIDWKVNTPVPVDIKKLPWPDRSQFYTYKDRYRYLELVPCAHVRTAFSCPFKCVFCYRNTLNCSTYTSRDIKDVVDEIESIDCENIYFIDDDFMIDRNRVEEFIRLVKERNIKRKYVCYARADFIAANEDLFPILKEIGFYYILTGLEAMDESKLSDYNKKTSIETNEKAIRIVEDNGMNMMGMFIVDPDFKGKDFRRMYRYIKKKKLIHAAVSIFTPELGSSLYEKYKDRIVSDNPEHWDYLHIVFEPTYLSVKRYWFHYHVLIGKLFVRSFFAGIYDFLDYGYYIKSILKNMFRFAG